LLEGKNVNLRVIEKEDVPLLAEWSNSLEVNGDYEFFPQISRAETEKRLFEPGPFELKVFIIEKKDGGKIGYIVHYNMLHPMGKRLEIGYALVPSERGKGYCTEAAHIMVDYLFLSMNVARIQAHTSTRNLASQKVLEKAGFKKEGTVRKVTFVRGELHDSCLYSILREEWREPRMLTRAEKK
jgi:RimJ/RimL family protein N-acetyltransferase